MTWVLRNRSLLELVLLDVATILVFDGSEHIYLKIELLKKISLIISRVSFACIAVLSKTHMLNSSLVRLGTVSVGICSLISFPLFWPHTFSMNLHMGTLIIFLWNNFRKIYESLWMDHFFNKHACDLPVPSCVLTIRFWILACFRQWQDQDSNPRRQRRSRLWAKPCALLT